ncbi:hypothetical protein N2152v2_000599 [Parachlorella kessleri]
MAGTALRKDVTVQPEHGEKVTKQAGTSAPSVKPVESADNPATNDPTQPGGRLTRKKSMRVAEEYGSAAVLWNPWLNKGTNFSQEERRHRNMEGLLPPVEESLELQAERVTCQLREPGKTDLQRYSLLRQILSTNQTLYYKVLLDNLEELAPIVYVPTVGEACQKFDRIYRAPLGMYISAFQHRGRFKEVLHNWPSHVVQIIVVTDGSRILGLGDLGTNGIGISIGKVALYVAGGGFHPEHSLPVVLDVGCGRQELLDDKFYLGEKKQRLEGEEYYRVIDEFCAAVKETWPNCLLHVRLQGWEARRRVCWLYEGEGKGEGQGGLSFEDFETERAFEILQRQRDKLLCFNDDIQARGREKHWGVIADMPARGVPVGTGAVVTAGFVNGMRVQGTELSEARVVFYGAGSAAVGVADAIAAYSVQAGCGTLEDARKRIWMVDTDGLVTTERCHELPEHKKAYARNDGTPDMKDLKGIIAHVKPHALIGLSSQGGAWKKADIQELCKHCEHPLVFPLSNPTDKSEVTAEDAYKWSKGNCVFAAGSPFKPVEMDGQRFIPGQANNVFIFSGVGFGAVMARAEKVTDEMFAAATNAVAGCVSQQQLHRQKKLYPDMKDLRRVEARVSDQGPGEGSGLGQDDGAAAVDRSANAGEVAAAVAQAAWDSGVSRLSGPPDDWLEYVASLMWWPDCEEKAGDWVKQVKDFVEE